VNRTTGPDKTSGHPHVAAKRVVGSNQGVSSSYRFSGTFIVRLMGLCLVAIGLLVLAVVTLVVLAALPAPVLGAGVGVAAVAVLGVLLLGLLARRRVVVVQLDEAGYRVRHIRGAGVRQAEWWLVEEADAATVAGEQCVVLRLRDGRTTTIPVGVLAGRPQDFTDDLRQHLNRGHGYRRLRG
jgi:acyl dehydratase